MLPASNRGAGMNFGFPDVCLTPTPAGPVPIPYPNIAMNAQAVGFSPIVKVSGVNALNMGAKIPMTSGDEAGTAHPVFKQAGQYTMGNPVVFVDRLPAINLGSPTTGNAMNNAAGAVLVPSAVNVFYTLASPAGQSVAGDPHGRVLAPADVRALGEAMRGAGATGAPVRAAMLPDEVGYLKIAVITSDLPSRFRAEVRRLEDGGAAALVIDLRGCPGGDLDAMVRWTADFLDEGAEIVRIEDHEGDEIIHHARASAIYQLPVVVLVNEGTASAAELFAACVKAHGRALVMGAVTHGKASVQRLAPGAGDTFVSATAARCRSVGGVELHGIGVIPHRELPAATAPGGDPASDPWVVAAAQAARAVISSF